MVETIIPCIIKYLVLTIYKKNHIDIGSVGLCFITQFLVSNIKYIYSMIKITLVIFA